MGRILRSCHSTFVRKPLADPDAYPGTVADISTFLRLAVTGQTNSPDLYTVMQILGYDATISRIRNAISLLSD